MGDTYLRTSWYLFPSTTTDDKITFTFVQTLTIRVLRVLSVVSCDRNRYLPGVMIVPKALVRNYRCCCYCCYCRRFLPRLLSCPPLPPPTKSTHILPHALSVLVAFGLGDAHLVHAGVQYLYRTQTLLPVLGLLVQVLIFCLQVSTGKRGPMQLALRRRLSGRGWAGDIRTSRKYTIPHPCEIVGIASISPRRAPGVGCYLHSSTRLLLKSRNRSFRLLQQFKTRLKPSIKRKEKRVLRPKNISA